jgi:hypothetical protein
VSLPDTAAAFVKELKTRLTETAAQVDQKYPENGDLSISPSGEPVLKRESAKDILESAEMLRTHITQKMPTRNLLDILVNIEHWNELHAQLWSIVGLRSQGGTGGGALHTDGICDRLQSRAESSCPAYVGSGFGTRTLVCEQTPL